MFGRKPIRSRRFCPRCGESLYYVATFLSVFTGWRKRICCNPDCAHEDPGRVRIVTDTAQVL